METDFFFFFINIKWKRKIEIHIILNRDSRHTRLGVLLVLLLLLGCFSLGFLCTYVPIKCLYTHTHTPYMSTMSTCGTFCAYRFCSFFVWRVCEAVSRPASHSLNKNKNNEKCNYKPVLKEKYHIKYTENWETQQLSIYARTNEPKKEKTNKKR